MRPIVASRVVVNGQSYLALSFHRLLLEHEVDYIVQTSADGIHWNDTAQSLGTSQLNADGTLTVTYRDDQPITGRRVGFLRLSVKRRNS